jgi:uncharacterized protein YjbJ (UPF0337 family)
MLWTDVQKDWKSLSTNFKTKWSKLTNEDLTAIAGKREELVARLVRYYQKDKAALEKEVDDFIKTLKAVAK